MVKGVAGVMGTDGLCVEPCVAFRREPSPHLARVLVKVVSAVEAVATVEVVTPERTDASLKVGDEVPLRWRSKLCPRTCRTESSSVW